MRRLNRNLYIPTYDRINISRIFPILGTSSLWSVRLPASTTAGCNRSWTSGDRLVRVRLGIPGAHSFRQSFHFSTHSGLATTDRAMSQLKQVGTMQLLRFSV